MNAKTRLALIFSAFSLVACAHQAPGPTSVKDSSDIIRERELVAMPNARVRGLREGRAMDAAVVAERNHYPAPYYVLKMISQLAMFDDQIVPTRELYKKSRDRAKTLGEALVKNEKKLQAFFEDVHTKDDFDELERLVRESARLKGEIRLEHLKARIAMRHILTRSQLARYEALKGYDAAEDVP